MIFSNVCLGSKDLNDIYFRYVIGREDLKSGVQHGWLSSLANQTENPFVLVFDPVNNSTVILGGPPLKSMYVTSLYFTMTCMTSIGEFGNYAHR